MTALDDHFGPRRRTELSEIVPPTRTNWPTQPEHLRPILDLWDELRGEVHSVQSKKQRVNGARQWYGEDAGRDFTGVPALLRHQGRAGAGGARGPPPPAGRSRQGKLAAEGQPDELP